MTASSADPRFLIQQFETVRLERWSQVAWLTLQRPKSLNSLGPTSVHDLHSALDLVQADISLRATVITGQGRAFCAGADLTAVRGFGDAKTQGAASQAFRGAANDLMRRLEEFARPVIAAVNGLALAGGLELVLACDLVVASEDAVFGDAHARYGLLPGWGGSVRLPRRIGRSRAKRMMFTADHFPAHLMQEWGLVDDVVPRAKLEDTVLDLCGRIVDKSPLGIQKMKKLVDESFDQPFESALRSENLAVLQHELSKDRQEGLEAFAAKRKPIFIGE